MLSLLISLNYASLLRLYLLEIMVSIQFSASVFGSQNFGTGSGSKFSVFKATVPVPVIDFWASRLIGKAPTNRISCWGSCSWDFTQILEEQPSDMLQANQVHVSSLYIQVIASSTFNKKFIASSTYC